MEQVLSSAYASTSGTGSQVVQADTIRSHQASDSEHFHTPLDPLQIRALRKHWIGGNDGTDLKGLMYYTMLLLSCKIFLRADEALSIEHDDFLTDHFIVKTDGKIEALLLRIKNSRQPSRPYYFFLWADHMCTDMCPVRHLLVYIELLNWKGGYLFPDVHQLTSQTSRPSTGIYDSHISYKSFDNAPQASCIDYFACHGFCQHWLAHVCRHCLSPCDTRPRREIPVPSLV